MKFSDLLNIGTFCAVKAGRWSGRKTMRLPEIGIQVDKEAEHRTTQNWVLVDSKLFAPVDSVSRLAYHALDMVSAPVPLGIGSLNLVPLGQVQTLFEQLAEIKASYDAAADRFCAEAYPKIREAEKIRNRRVAAQLYDRYFSGDPNAVNRQVYDARFEDFLRAAYLEPGKLRASMYLNYARMEIDIGEEGGLGGEAPLTDALGQMVNSLREAAGERLEQGIETILTSQRLGPSVLKTIQRDLNRLVSKNVLGDSVVVDAAKKTVNYFRGRDPKWVKENREEVAAAMRDIAKVIKTPSNGDVAEITRMLEGATKRKLRL